ncbi:MAG: acyl-CoA dehydratase activase, partial [Dehalococcoidia bacterium]|nr:acyl-CoA dehydratase activase [Dehalococcoidia bacterium]
MSYSLGLDIGSASVKLSLIGEAGAAVHFDALGLLSSPAVTVNALLGRLPPGIALDDIASAGVTGVGQTTVPAKAGWSYFSNALATAAGALSAYPTVRTIIQIGAQSSLVVELEDGLKRPWKVATNPLCAAGTGRFLEQQAYRLGISLDELARLALGCQGKPPRIAARCSVFAKSDLIHLQQKGVPVPALLYGLCEAVARLVVSLKKGSFCEPVLLVGGVAGNRAILNALEEALTLRNGQATGVTVPDNYLHIQALGAAYLARDSGQPAQLPLEEEGSKAHYELSALPQVTATRAEAAGIKGICCGYLGVDVGSTSTKAVILDETGKTVLAKSYLMTAGQPVAAVQQVCRNLLEAGAGQVKVLAAGITGSGRYLVGSFIGADLIKNEITAQARAASELDSEADVIEIGGQDSKLIIKRAGAVADYQMNKACAAGTGSFIDELAELLGVTAKNGDFARLALSAPYTVDLGSRCAAFIGQAVAAARQEGLGLDVITASLTNSIAKNYLSKVVAHRRLGRKIILTGAVFYNEAVIAAFRQQLPDKELLVAEHREVSGAIGAALLAKEEAKGATSCFKGFAAVAEGHCELSSFTCKHCDNNCAITRMKLADGGATYYGSRCDRYDAEAGAKKQATYFEARAELLFADYREGMGSGLTVGIPRALQVYDFAPLLLGFLSALGVKTVLSSTTNQEIMEQAVELGYTDSCLPIKLLYGHTASLANRCDFILYPCSIRMGLQDGNENQKYSCPLVQASPFMLRSAFGLGKRLLVPILDFSRGETEVINNLTTVAHELGFAHGQGRAAALAGLASQKRFEAARLSLGRRILSELKESGRPGVVIFARSYMSQDPGANLGVAEKLAQLGVAAVPLDCLPLESVNPRMVSDRPYWFYESKFIAGATIVTGTSGLFGLVIGNFGCGPNSFMLNIIEDVMAGKPLGQIEIDEHAAEAGLVTRLEAFTDTI